MFRSSPLRVERLEDRCVPTADPLDLTVAAVVETAPVDQTAPADATSAPDTQFVIDVYLIDPNDPTLAPKPADTTDPGSTWGDQSPVPPIGDPFWN